jgi:hypothetical protein
MPAALPTDTQPWHQQFWPWFLIFLPASVVVAGFVTLYIANKHSDDLVTDDYYKNGLAINRQIEKIERATALGISATLQMSEHSVAVTVAGAVEADTLTLYLSHPMEADRDMTIELVRVEPGFYAGTLEQTAFSRWHWTLENPGEPRWRLNGSVDLNSSGNAAPY